MFIKKQNHDTLTLHKPSIKRKWKVTYFQTSYQKGDKYMRRKQQSFLPTSLVSLGLGTLFLFSFKSSTLFFSLTHNLHLKPKSSNSNFVNRIAPFSPNLPTRKDQPFLFLSTWLWELSRGHGQPTN